MVVWIIIVCSCLTLSFSVGTKTTPNIEQSIALYFMKSSVFVNNTNLINIQDATLVVEACVQLVQHGDDLHGRTLGTHSSEAHNVREEHGHVVELASRHRVALPQFLSHVTRKYGIQEIHGPPLFFFQSLVCPLQCGLSAQTHEKRSRGL